MKRYFYSVVAFIFVMLPRFSQALDMPSANGLPTHGSLDSVFEGIIEAILKIVGSLAVLMIIISGIMYMVSGGDSTRAETAKKLLTYSIIGLVVVLLSYLIVVFVSDMLGA